MIASSTAERLRSRLRGELLTPSDPGYDAARRVFNGAIDRRPALIARCRNSDDVVLAVNVGREQNLLCRFAARATTWPAMRCAMTAS